MRTLQVILLQLIILATMNIRISGQNNFSESIVDQMIDEKIITFQGGLTLSNSIEKYSITTNSGILKILSEIYGKEFLDRSNLYSYYKEILSSKGNKNKVTLDKDSINYDEEFVIIDKLLEGKSFIPNGLSSGLIQGQGLSIEQNNLVPPTQSVFGRNLISLSSKLIKLGIITEDYQQDYINRLKDESPPESMMLFYYSFLVEEFEKQPNINKEIQLKFDKWKKSGVINPNAEIDFKQVSELFDVLNYSPVSIILNTNELVDDPKEAYGLIYERVGELVGYPLTLGDLKFKVIDREEDNPIFKTIKAEIILVHNGRNYIDTIFYSSVGYNNTLEEALSTKLTPNFISIVNKFLVSVDNCRRLYYVEPDRKKGEFVGIIVLDKDQYSDVQFFDRGRFLDGPHPEEALNNCVSNQIIQEAIDLQLIESPPSKEDKLNARSLMSSILMNSKLRMSQPYKIKNLTNLGFLKLFASVSNDEIKFENANVEYMNEENDKLIFDFRGKNFEYLVSKNKAFDFELYKHISKLLKADVGTSNFYVLGYNQYDIGIMYLSSDQKKWIKRNSVNIWIGDY